MSYDSTTVTPRRASIPLLLGTFLLLACAGAGEDRPRPNVLLLSIDALRADHLGVYGYAAAETPALDGFASRGVRFENAISQASWTLPSVTSLFLSQYPSTHGVQSPRQRLSADAETLALLMRNGGYRTAALMMGAYTSAEFGMDRGFESFRANTGRMPEKNQLALDWIDSTEEPFFLYMHYVDVHHPYNSRNPYAADRERRKYSVSGKTPLGKLRTSLTPEGLEELIAQYDAGVSYADYHFGEFIQALDERGLLERTVILVTADHGEAFLEHDRRLGHRGPPFEEQVRVPLLVVGPSIPSGVAVAEPVQAIDLAPTILALAGIPAGEGMQGREFAIRRPARRAGRVDRFQPGRSGVGGSDARVEVALQQPRRVGSLVPSEGGPWRGDRCQFRVSGRSEEPRKRPCRSPPSQRGAGGELPGRKGDARGGDAAATRGAGICGQDLRQGRDT